jgi:hypothetical protein
LNTLNLELFHWHSDSQTLTAEISELPVRELPRLLEIVNEKSKQSRKFIYSKVETDREGDVQAWHYRGDGHPLKLTIWND